MTPLEAMLVRHEGKRSKVYTDTVGKRTIGVGRNLDDVGLSDDEIMILLRNDIKRTQEFLNGFSWFRRLDQDRADAITDMVFNIGPAGFAKFTKLICALTAGAYGQAADEMMSSMWAKQVGARAEQLAAIMRGQG